MRHTITVLTYIKEKERNSSKTFFEKALHSLANLLILHIKHYRLHFCNHKANTYLGGFFE